MNQKDTMKTKTALTLAYALTLADIAALKATEGTPDAIPAAVALAVALAFLAYALHTATRPR
jgi:hypothetical protein